MKSVCGVLLILALSCYGEEDSPAHLLASKTIQNKYLVEGMDTVVKYSLYNVGQTAALNVQVEEKGFRTEDFEIVGGDLQVTYERIPPGGNVSHVLVVRPIKYGYFNFTAALVTYYSTEDANEPTIAFTSEPGEGGIVPFKDFDRKFSSHTLDWTIFAVMALPFLLFPYALWSSSKRNYDNTLAQYRKIHSGKEQ
ncbi:translocon-associated protein subunit beta-like [Artemia franciscana]|uniref:translocon-associated protein subunit beta-like n=1 Tax=Artemia franciscana TaxID=6661 RepID=UPI0032DBD6F0